MSQALGLVNGSGRGTTVPRLCRAYVRRSTPGLHPICASRDNPRSYGCRPNGGNGLRWPHLDAGHSCKGLLRGSNPTFIYRARRRIAGPSHGLQLVGIGIRRAKHTIADNGNPPLLFEPLNDTDDHTMVACPINEEFAHIRDFGDEATRKTSEKTTTNAQEIPEDIVSTSENTSEKTLHYLRSNPKASAKEMANLFGLSQRAIEHQLRAPGRRGVYNEMGRPKAANRL